MRRKAKQESTTDEYTYDPNVFTDSEVERLSAVQMQADIEFEEMNQPVLRRLEFARYLIERGIISELL